MLSKLKQILTDKELLVVILICLISVTTIIFLTPVVVLLIMLLTVSLVYLRIREIIKNN